MVKDKRYNTIKNLIQGGFIKSFPEIFDTLPKSVVYRDLGMNSIRFNNLLQNVDRFMLHDIFRIAGLIEVDEKKILDLIYEQYISTKKKKRRSE